MTEGSRMVAKNIGIVTYDILISLWYDSHAKVIFFAISLAKGIFVKEAHMFEDVSLDIHAKSIPCRNPFICVDRLIFHQLSHVFQRPSVRQIVICVNFRNAECPCRVGQRRNCHDPFIWIRGNHQFFKPLFGHYSVAIEKHHICIAGLYPYIDGFNISQVPGICHYHDISLGLIRW